MRPAVFASSNGIRFTSFGRDSSGRMTASSSFSMSGAAAAPVSDFTLKPLSGHGLWLAVITIPALAFFRILADENDFVGAAALGKDTRMPCAATNSAGAAAQWADAQRWALP